MRELPFLIWRRPRGVFDNLGRRQTPDQKGHFDQEVELWMETKEWRRRCRRSGNG